MGRKIPGKKHRGVKDVNKQRAARLSELKSKTNDPPKNTDDQDIPKSLLRLIKLKNDAKNKSRGQNIKKKKKKKSSKLIAVGGDYNSFACRKGKPDKLIPVFNQRPFESEQQFLNRVDRETEAFIKETEFESKFSVDVMRDVKTGEVEGIKKKLKNESSEIDALKIKHKNVNKKPKAGINKLTQTQKKKQRLMEKKLRKAEDSIQDFSSFKDNVEFGDVVHAPPELKVHPKYLNKHPNKPKNKDLLLSSILEDKKSCNSVNTKVMNKMGKRKNLPLGMRRQIEKQQNDVVAAYRLLKSKKFGESAVPV